MGSKNIKSRAAVQKRLNKLLSSINENSNSLDSPFTITLGDEFQALYKEADKIFNDIWKIMFALYPERVRFSIGVGKLNTKINRWQAIGMDGPAFYSAREGLNRLKANSYLLCISGKDLDNSELINQILFFVSFSIKKWKYTRMNIFNFLLEDMPVKSIARKLRMSDKAVYKNIDTGGMYLMINIFDEITKGHF